MRRSNAPVWTKPDAALAYTCRLAASLFDGRSLDYEPQAAYFAPQIGENEQFVALAPYNRSVFDAPGDGSYEVSNGGGGMMYLTSSGANAVGFGLGQAAVNGIFNGRARRRAAADAQPRWMFAESGTVYVSTHGFYLCPPTGEILPWGWGGITQLVLTGRNQVEMLGKTDDGDRVRWAIQSPYAEMILLSWAWMVNRQHPSLQRGGWLPPGWLGWAVEQGQLSHEVATSIAHFDQLRNN